MPKGHWRSLELHQHHRALGLAPLSTGGSSVSGTAIDIAKGKPVQPVTIEKATVS